MTSAHTLRRALASLVLAAAFAGLAPAAGAATALDHLRAAPRPRFNKGHSLPPLTRWGWRMPYAVRVELAEHWGYALELGTVTERMVEQLDEPDSVPARLCALAASEPERYPLCGLVWRTCLDEDFRKGLPPETWCRDAEGSVIEPKGRRTWSPEAPDAVFERAGALAAEPLRRLQAKAGVPLAMVLNGGEYALTVYGHAHKVWKQDPRVVAAKGERPWFDYISERKAHQEAIIANAIRQACPDRTLYIYYYADGCPHRNRYGGWWRWAWGYRWMQAVSDLPSSSNYYNHFNSGWTGNNDLLTQTLNSVAQQIAQDDPLSYNWVCSGWTRPKLGERAFADDAHYAGYLKCYYTAGMLGACAGYFSYPDGGFKDDVGAEPPSWLRQMMVLARVHALFSHLEDLLRRGDLLPGPARHRWSKDLPAYEFPTGDASLRVVARKHREREAWLLCAWAAGGDDRQITVTIPGLGEVRLGARACGSVYRAVVEDGKPSLTLVDEDGLLPTAGR
ncbi:MAG: hypothetical protein ACODAJ_06710 [Planctomycetota bacterium]